jgi:radical SAM protein with 4Fe4S-binding SPASM domain
VKILKYTFAPEFLFRGYERLPFVGILPYGRHFNLTPGMIDELEKCDGITDVPEVSEDLQKLINYRAVVPGEQPPNDFQKYRYHKNRYFPEVKWQITGRCNYKCRHCFNALDNSPVFEEFTLSEAKDLIAEMKRCGIQKIELTGGEPTLHPNFIEIIDELCSAQIEVKTISTNASTMTPLLLSKIKSFGIKPEFRMSFDGIGYHDEFRGFKNAENKLIDTIKLLNSEDFSVKIETNVNTENTDTILPTAELMDDLGVNFMRIIRTSESPRWFQNCKKQFTIKDYYEFALQFAEDYLKKPHNLPVNIWHALSVDPYSRTVMTGTENSTYRGRATVCGQNRGVISIANSGEIAPCNQMNGVMQKMGITLGNVKKTPLQNLLSDAFADSSFKTGFYMKKPEISAITAMVTGDSAYGDGLIADIGGQFESETEIFPKSYLGAVDMRVDDLMKRIPRCASCKYHERCQGGCRLIGFTTTGSYMQRDIASCIWFFEGFGDRLEALGKRLNETGTPQSGEQI